MAALSDYEVPFSSTNNPTVKSDEFLNQVNVTIPLSLLQCVDCGRICHKTIVIQCGHKYCASCLLPKLADRITNCESCHRNISHEEVVYSADWDQLIEAARQGNDMAEMEDTELWDRREMGALKILLQRYHGYDLSVVSNPPSSLETDTVYTVDSMETAIAPQELFLPRVPVEEPIELLSSSSEESSSVGSGLMARAIRVERGDLRGYDMVSIINSDSTTSSRTSSNSTGTGVPSLEEDASTAAEEETDSTSIDVVSLASSFTQENSQQPTVRSQEEGTSSSVVILSGSSFSSASTIAVTSPARSQRIQLDEFQASQLLNRYIELCSRLEESMTLVTAHE